MPGNLHGQNHFELSPKDFANAVLAIMVFSDDIIQRLTVRAEDSPTAGFNDAVYDLVGNRVCLLLRILVLDQL